MFGLANFRRGMAWSLAVAAALGSYDEARAVLVISAFDSPMTESFDAFAGTNATIPQNFVFSANAATSVERNTYDSAGAYNNNNGLYALYHTPTTGASEFAFGTKLQPGSTADLTWSFVNQTGSDISEFDVSWDVEQYSFGGRPTAIDFSYDPNGSGFTQAGISGTTLTTNADLGGGSGQNLSSPTNTSRSVSITLATPLANGASIDVRWTTTGSTGSGANAHMGVDNLSVTATQTIPEAAAGWFGGLACAASVMIRLVGRRRRERACI